MVIGLPPIVIPSQIICEDCALSKQHRSPFPQGKLWRVNNVLELIHSNICNPINPSSNGGKKYVITFIDDCTRKTWVYFLQDKSKAFGAFKNFKAHVENEIEKSMKAFPIDHGREYCSKEFDIFCDKQGIRKELTATYSPQ